MNAGTNTAKVPFRYHTLMICLCPSFLRSLPGAGTRGITHDLQAYHLYRLGSGSGIYVEGESKLAGFARVISDYATTYYLCDVVIDEDYQHKGLGTALVSYIESLPVYEGLRGILVTRDAYNDIHLAEEVS